MYRLPLWEAALTHLKNRIIECMNQGLENLAQLNSKYSKPPILQLVFERPDNSYAYAVGHHGVTAIEETGDFHTFRIVMDDEAFVMYLPTGYTLHYVAKPESEEPQLTVIH